jgi:hypothetical protein
MTEEELEKELQKLESKASWYGKIWFKVGRFIDKKTKKFPILNNVLMLTWIFLFNELLMLIYIALGITFILIIKSK